MLPGRGGKAPNNRPVSPPQNLRAPMNQAPVRPGQMQRRPTQQCISSQPPGARPPYNQGSTSPRPFVNPPPQRPPTNQPAASPARAVRSPPNKPASPPRTVRALTNQPNPGAERAARGPSQQPVMSPDMGARYSANQQTPRQMIPAVQPPMSPPLAPRRSVYSPVNAPERLARQSIAQPNVAQDWNQPAMGPGQVLRMPANQQNLMPQGFAMPPPNQQMMNPGQFMRPRQPQPMMDPDMVDGGLYDIPRIVLPEDFEGQRSPGYDPRLRRPQ